MNYSPHKLTLSDINSEYQRAKRHYGICNDNSKRKILIHGENALRIINHYAVDKMAVSDRNKYTVLKSKHCFIDEVLILKIAIHKYIIITNNFKEVLKRFKRIQKLYPLTVFSDVSRYYTAFSFHGNDAYNFFNNLQNALLYKTIHQGYSYFQLLAPKREESAILNYFTGIGFVPICLATKQIFLYNNRVITNFNDIKRKYKKILLNTVYKNYSNATSPYSVEVFEVLETSIVPKNNKLYDYKRKVCGIVYCAFRLPTSKFPFIIGLVNSLNANLLITKLDKQEILVRKQYKK